MVGVSSRGLNNFKSKEINENQILSRNFTVK